MGVTLSASTPVQLGVGITDQGGALAMLAGGGFVALDDKTSSGGGALQVFDSTGAPVGAAVKVAPYGGGNGGGFGTLALAGLTGGGFVAVTTDATVHSGQTDVVARVYSATGTLTQTLVVDSAPAGSTEFAPSVVATADGGFQVLWTDDGPRGNTTFTTTRPTPSDTQSVTEGRDVFVHAFAPVNGTWQSRTAGDVQINAPGFFTDAADQQTNAWSPDSALLTNGNVVVAYDDHPVYNGSNGYFNQWAFSSGVSFSVLGADGQTVVGRTVVRNDLNSTSALSYNYIDDPSVSAAGGGFAYVYDERDIPQGQDYYQGVHVRFFNADGSSASNDVLVSPAGVNAFYGKAAPLANGAGVAVVYETENPNAYLVTRDLYIETFDTSGHVLSGPTLVTDQLQRPGGSYYPQADYSIAARADGSLQVVYEQYDPSNGGHTNLESEVLNVVQTVNLPAATAAAVSGVLRIDPNAASSQAFDATLVNLAPAAAVSAVVSAAINTTAVADLAYQFFTGHTPSAAGIDYLVSPTGPNGNNLNSAYYQSFNVENRYINFAVNLGKLGEGAAAFQSAYGSLSFYDAFKQAYGVIFGATPTDAKIHAILDPTVTSNGQQITRQQYFAFYGGDGLDGIGTKAAAVGWLMSEAEKADLGTYAKANDAFLTDVASGHGAFGADLIGAYGQPGFAYHG